MISVRFQCKPFNITVIQIYAPTSNTEEAEVERFYEDLHLYHLHYLRSQTNPVSLLTPTWMTFNTLHYSHELVSPTLMIHEMSPWGGGNLCLIGCSYLQHLSVDIC